MCASDFKCLSAIGSGEEFIAVYGEARLEDIHVHGLVIDDEDAWRRSHSLLLAVTIVRIYGTYWRIFASRARGL